jgi:hypothetical protein
MRYGYFFSKFKKKGAATGRRLPWLSFRQRGSHRRGEWGGGCQREGRRRGCRRRGGRWRGAHRRGGRWGGACFQSPFVETPHRV